MLSWAGKRDNMVLHEKGPEPAAASGRATRKQGLNPRKIVGYNIVGV